MLWFGKSYIYDAFHFKFWTCYWLGGNISEALNFVCPRTWRYTALKWGMRTTFVYLYKSWLDTACIGMRVRFVSKDDEHFYVFANLRLHESQPSPLIFVLVVFLVFSLVLVPLKSTRELFNKRWHRHHSRCYWFGVGSYARSLCFIVNVLLGCRINRVFYTPDVPL